MTLLHQIPLAKCSSEALAERPCYHLAKKLMPNASKEALIEATENLETYVQTLYQIYDRHRSLELMNDAEKCSVLRVRE
jgi:hypothetical protein